VQRNPRGTVAGQPACRPMEHSASCRQIMPVANASFAGGGGAGGVRTRYRWIMSGLGACAPGREPSCHAASSPVGRFPLSNPAEYSLLPIAGQLVSPATVMGPLFGVFCHGHAGKRHPVKRRPAGPLRGCWIRADPRLPGTPPTCGNCPVVGDHPDLRGNQPDPARGDGPAAAEVASLPAFALVNGYLSGGAPVVRTGLRAGRGRPGRSGRRSGGRSGCSEIHDASAIRSALRRCTRIA